MIISLLILPAVFLVTWTIRWLLTSPTVSSSASTWSNRLKNFNRWVFGLLSRGVSTLGTKGLGTFVAVVVLLAFGLYGLGEQRPGLLSRLWTQTPWWLPFIGVAALFLIWTQTKKKTRLVLTLGAAIVLLRLGPWHVVINETRVALPQYFAFFEEKIPPPSPCSNVYHTVTLTPTIQPLYGASCNYGFAVRGGNAEFVGSDFEGSKTLRPREEEPAHTEDLIGVYTKSPGLVTLSVTDCDKPWVSVNFHCVAKSAAR